MKNQTKNLIQKSDKDARNGPRRTSLIRTIALVMLIAVVMSLVATASADHDPGHTTGTTDGVLDPALAPVQVTTTLEGCRGENLPAGYPLEALDFLCDQDYPNPGDTVDAYTTGNMGKTWNELDLVPHRITLDNGNGDQTYEIAIVGDHENTGTIGWDLISEPELNTDLSIPAAGFTLAESCQLVPGPETIADIGVGGADDSIFRVLTVTQKADSTCVYDYVQRLAGPNKASLYSGSSLQSLLVDLGTGEKRIQLPTGDISPQKLNKDMAATQGADFVWNLTKGATPAEWDFGCTCEEGNEDPSTEVAVRVEWEKIAVAGELKIVTNIYATNPSKRTITYEVSDEIFDALNASRGTEGPDSVDVPPNVAGYLVATYDFDISDGGDHVGETWSNTATAELIDFKFGIPLGELEVSSDALVAAGTQINATAVITDVESIFDSGGKLSYSVDSVSGATGAFQGGYTLGTTTQADVTWVSDSQNADGFVEFSKTVYLDGPAIVTDGKLSDVASLLASDGYAPDNATAKTDFTSDVTVDLTIEKTINVDLLQGGETETFVFDITGPNSYANQVSLTFNAGETSKSATLSGLEPGTYTVTEQAKAGWTIEGPKNITLDPLTNGSADCSGTLTFENKIVPATSQVKKVTDPAGNEAGWEFTLYRDEDPDPDVMVATATTTDAGYVGFGVDLTEGSYYVEETAKDGWDNSGTSGDCAFTVNYPADAGKTYQCTFTNTQRGKIIVDKVTYPGGSAQLFDFDASWLVPDVDFQLADGTDPFDSGFLVPGNYSVAEVNIPSDWDLTKAECDDNNSLNPATLVLDPGETIKCTFTNTQRGKIIVDKVTYPGGSAQLFDFDASWLVPDVDFQLADGTDPFDSGFLVPGNYSVGEVNIPIDWDFTKVTCNDEDFENPAALELDPGETITCIFTNTQRGMVDLLKTVDGGLPGGWSFQFDLRVGASPESVGTVVSKAYYDIVYNDTSGMWEVLYGTDPVSGEAMFRCADTASAQECVDFVTDERNISIPDDDLVAAKLPPGDYQLCETGMMPGWMTSLSDDTQYPDNFVPGAAVDSMTDNSTICIPFTLDAGGTQSFTVDNLTPPGGDARTPGFWKNWSSVTGGNQEAVLDATISNSPYIGPNSLPGFWVGDLFVEDAETAYHVLSKEKTNKPFRKAANDAAYEAATFKLVAELNVNAFVPSGFGNQQARQCQALLDGIAATQALLEEVGFDGTGGYLDAKTVKNDPYLEGLRTTALEYAGWLDLYANNEAGPWSCLENDGFPD